MYEIELVGLASGSTRKFLIKDEELKKTLLEFLLEKKIPIAYSCNYEGICKKCIFNGELLSCKFRIIDLKRRNIHQVKISYI